MRLLDIVFYLLRSSSKVTIKELSKVFNVSTKTIRRDLDKLSIIGIPIITYRGVNGGVEIDKNYIIAKHVLKYSDYESLIFALYIGESISKNISESFLIDKFKSVDKSKCTKILDNIKDRFIIDLFEDKFDTKTEICKDIDIALDNKSFIELEINDEKFEVYPISYILRKDGLCLYCYKNILLLILTKYLML
ncbi:helix-turn-helix transcriptional regulator [Romboutsia sp. Marseille-P6047]|uniref:helix-turn-helix transcriptional regulator n=1 Tax=Romboutsia sp. Marseille-P6047 TaxID=2161817 RepID=UPI001FAA4DD6|nr:HTH domain-containing protein [Romboutsia sp. Marseille-P6047]